MTTTRREFIQATTGALGAMGLADAVASVDAVASSATSAAIAGGSGKKLLILGGSGFIGPHMVRAALEQDYEVTIFNRGKTNPHLFPDIEKLKGDRDGGLDSLKGRDWDAVIDNTGYVPRHVRDSADLLQGHVGRYLFTSTVSVFKPTKEPIHEDSALLEAPDPESEEVNKYYGELKVLCEQIVSARYGDAATIVRPHLVAGPGDNTDRYTYWPVRLNHGGEILCPGNPSHPTQYIEVRDLAEFCLHLVTEGTPGFYNGVGPTYSPLSMQELIYAIRGVVANDLKFTWVDEDFLAGHGIESFGFPVWVSQNSDYAGFTLCSTERSVAAGLRFRPLADTAHDTLEWFLQQPQERRDKVQLNLERDAKILAEWAGSRSAASG